MTETNKNTRKRGDILIENIYAATSEIIKEVGYVNLTFQEIAKTSKTSRTVLYRRWNTTFELIQELISYKFSKTLNGNLFDKIEDTGSLRSDLLQLLTLHQSVYKTIGPEILNAFLFEMSQSNKSIDEMKPQLINSSILIMKKILGFAEARGDKIKKVSNNTLILPLNLLRAGNVFFKDSINENRLELLVDEVLLPVFKE